MKFTKALLKTKLKAVGIHLCLSLIVFFILAYQIFYVWYPLPYFFVDGGWQGIRIVAAVDLVLGPLITFLIFDLSKSRREITFDLLTIATIQIGALMYGVMTTYDQRPVAIVVIDEFVISVIESDYGSQLGSLEELKQFSPESPPIIYADIPLSREALDEITRIKMEDKIVEHAQIQLYQPHPMLAIGLQNRQQSYRSRLAKSAANKDYEQWLTQNQKQSDDVLVAPFNGRYGRVWLVFDNNGRYLDYI
jgi:hypothetical protein